MGRTDLNDITAFLAIARDGGFTKLQVRARPARMGRNPATGASIKIAASKKIAFRPAKELKEAV